MEADGAIGHDYMILEKEAGTAASANFTSKADSFLLEGTANPAKLYYRNEQASTGTTLNFNIKNFATRGQTYLIGNMTTGTGTFNINHPIYVLDGSLEFQLLGGGYTGNFNLTQAVHGPEEGGTATLYFHNARTSGTGSNYTFTGDGSTFQGSVIWRNPGSRAATFNLKQPLGTAVAYEVASATGGQNWTFNIEAYALNGATAFTFGKSGTLVNIKGIQDIPAAAFALNAGTTLNFQADANIGTLAGVAEAIIKGTGTLDVTQAEDKSVASSVTLPKIIKRGAAPLRLTGATAVPALQVESGVLQVSNAQGSITKNGSGTLLLSSPQVNLDGAVEVQTGSLAVSANFDCLASLEMAAGTTLSLADGTWQPVSCDYFSLGLGVSIDGALDLSALTRTNVCLAITSDYNLENELVAPAIILSESEGAGLTLPGMIIIDNVGATPLVAGQYLLANQCLNTLAPTPLEHSVLGQGMGPGLEAWLLVEDGQLLLNLIEPVFSEGGVSVEVDTTSLIYGQQAQITISTDPILAGSAYISRNNVYGEILAQAELDANGEAIIHLAMDTRLALGDNHLAVYCSDGTVINQAPGFTLNLQPRVLNLQLSARKLFDNTTAAHITHAPFSLPFDDEITVGGSYDTAAVGQGKYVDLSYSFSPAAIQDYYTITPLILNTGAIYDALAVWTGAGADGLWHTPANWNNQLVPNHALHGAKFHNNNALVVELNAPVTLKDLVFSGDAPGAVTLNGNEEHAFTGAANFKVEVANNQTATIVATLYGSAGINKAGAGGLVLSGTNDFSGKINLPAGAGILRIDNPLALPDAATVAITKDSTQKGGILQLNTPGVNSYGVAFEGFKSITAYPGGELAIENLQGTNTLTAQIALTSTGGNGVNFGCQAGQLVLNNIHTTVSTGRMNTYYVAAGASIKLPNAITANSDVFTAFSSGAGTLYLMGENNKVVSLDMADSTTVYLGATTQNTIQATANLNVKEAANVTLHLGSVSQTFANATLGGGLALVSSFNPVSEEWGSLQITGTVTGAGAIHRVVFEEVDENLLDHRREYEIFTGAAGSLNKETLVTSGLPRTWRARVSADGSQLCVVPQQGTVIFVR